MAEKSKQQSQIPRFKSLEEAAEFWDSHSPLEFESELKEVKIKFARPLIHILEVELDAGTIDALTAAGAKEGISAHALARTWLLERLSGEQDQEHSTTAADRQRMREKPSSAEELGSSSIAWVYYDPNCQKLQVCFRQSGETYMYLGVEPETYERFLASDSRGRFLNREIKGHYDFEKLG